MDVKLVNLWIMCVLVSMVHAGAKSGAAVKMPPMIVMNEVEDSYGSDTPSLTMPSSQMEISMEDVPAMPMMAIYDANSGSAMTNGPMDMTTSDSKRMMRMMSMKGGKGGMQMMGKRGGSQMAGGYGGMMSGGNMRMMMKPISGKSGGKSSGGMKKSGGESSGRQSAGYGGMSGGQASSSGKGSGSQMSGGGGGY